MLFFKLERYAKNIVEQGMFGNKSFLLKLTFCNRRHRNKLHLRDCEKAMNVLLCPRCAAVPKKRGGAEKGSDLVTAGILMGRRRRRRDA